ncbi:hypothetical protein FGSG_13227 [Fusarium graminearum PH-1]|uniref:Chromosome 4, complete genome n=1 Tax=Gibberella zeae (strain ATCC MYA-4620 / CBS 123657 / FGSC 9075 / NRRL 31084 / PH-1) TaxID=229533 RepID=I1S8P9_GIBZE|nr:hypothetical protein FGSG_13227 [Fusarium graminearum PH-1]ESU14126.1 hypothetical protein FGSG_13227 [Fusarium graminearum PH-1]CEF84902.1 unnamed protein product [Fusarium graminearum]|eukprot:XP_011327633.1 hypothetical protein FGSG_13227 [Fusarium graminearum PH-1]
MMQSASKAKQEEYLANGGSSRSRLEVYLCAYKGSKKSDRAKTGKDLQVVDYNKKSTPVVGMSDRGEESLRGRRIESNKNRQKREWGQMGWVYIAQQFVRSDAGNAENFSNIWNVG